MGLGHLGMAGGELRQSSSLRKLLEAGADTPGVRADLRLEQEDQAASSGL